MTPEEQARALEARALGDLLNHAGWARLDEALQAWEHAALDKLAQPVLQSEESGYWRGRLATVRELRALPETLIRTAPGGHR